MADSGDSGSKAEEEFEEFAIPIDGARGRPAIIRGKIRTKLDPATLDYIAKLLADALVAEYMQQERDTPVTGGACEGTATNVPENVPATGQNQGKATPTQPRTEKKTPR